MVQGLFTADLDLGYERFREDAPVIDLADLASVRVSLCIENLLDEEYYIGNIRQGTFDSLGFSSGLATFGDPRSFGVTLDLLFE